MIYCQYLDAYKINVILLALKKIRSCAKAIVTEVNIHSKSSSFVRIAKVPKQKKSKKKWQTNFELTFE